jgi:hypothetical protein
MTVATRRWEASVRISGNQDHDDRDIVRLGIVRTLLVQVLVMLALSGAVTGYLKWSSDAAWKEFMDAGKSSAPDVKHSPQASAPLHAVQGHALCTRRV